jgi:hypothetical protein
LLLATLTAAWLFADFLRDVRERPSEAFLELFPPLLLLLTLHAGRISHDILPIRVGRKDTNLGGFRRAAVATLR